MLRVEFKPIGVDIKKNELYNMEKPQFEAECAMIRNDFRQWVWENFVLTGQQRDYLSKMPQNMLDTLSTALLSALENHEDVVLDDNPPPRQSSKMFTAQFPDGSDYLPERRGGTLVIKVQYILIH